MNITHKYDHYGRKEPSPVFLAKPGKRIFCALSGIDESSASITTKTNNTSTLTFTIDKYVDGKLTDGYEYIDEYMEIYCSGIWFKIMDPPVITNDGMREKKDVTAESYEIMLTQYTLKTFLINQGTEASYEMMYRQSHDTSQYYQVKFYDEKEPKLSLLHLVLSHADVPGWKIGYVDNITPDDDGVFLPDSICNFEVEDKNVYTFLTQEVSPAYKCVFEFDTVNMLINVYRPDSFGKDTNVVIGFRNIQDNITISRDESLVTQFYVDGLNDYNIDSVNFGSSVITDISYFIKEPYMSQNLQNKYNAWSNYQESRREEYINLSKEYNGYLTTLTELMYRVPIDTVKNNWFGSDVEDLKSAYDENIAIIRGLEGLYVDEEGNFDLEALKKSSDWNLYSSTLNYTIPSIVAALQAKDETVDGYGKGNIISCVNPVVMGDDWLYLGAGNTTYETIQIDNAPAYGITRGVKVSGDGGIRQKNITVEQYQEYVLSCFVKGSGSFNLEYGDTGQDRKSSSYTLSSSWQRVFTSFNPGSKLIDVAFTGTDFTVCGMQLEMGRNPSQFGYFIQSENILKAYETDWKLYGISELKIKISTYEGCAEELKKNGYAGEYNPLADYEEAYFTQMHQMYLDYLRLIEEAKVALAERQAEYDPVKALQDSIEDKRKQIIQDVDINNFHKVQTEFDAFSDDEKYIIKSLYNQATYTNQNIIVTSLDDTVDAVDKQKKLYDDAIEELYIESHPQMTYEDSINNIYALPEFKEFHGELQVNNFVRVGVTDRDYVKLRVTEITFNPLALDESMELKFSNMIQYRSKRSDMMELINDAGQSSDRVGGSVTSVNKSNTSDYVISADVIKQIFSNPLFSSIISGSTVGGSGSGGTITAEKVIAEIVKADEAIIGKLTADTAFIKYLDTNLVSSDKVVTKILNADKATIETLSSTLIEANVINVDVANIKNLLAGKVGVGELITIHLNADNAVFDSLLVKNIIAENITVADLKTHTATSQQIVLVSSDGSHPTIAFQDSTQQFYDSEGNVRVQIGQDGNGDFNFIVRGADGTTALFDSNGIKKDGIPDNTIVNNMIESDTISKDKLNFPIVETDENGNISITNILDGSGKNFGMEYTEFKTGITNQVTEVKSTVDAIDGTIRDVIKEVVFDDQANAINSKFSEIIQNVDGITQTVSSMQTDFTDTLNAHQTQITQTADTLSLIATGNSESGITLTDSFIELVSDTISISADNLNVDAVVKLINTAKDGSHTLIDGGVIDTDTVNAMLIKTRLLKSENYTDYSPIDDIYSLSGLMIDMQTGQIKSNNFGIDTDGNAYFKGNGEFEGKVIANSGQIGGVNGFTIMSGKLYSGMISFDSSSNGVYIGTDGIALGGGKFKVDSYGNVTANNGTFKGEIIATSGQIAGNLVTSGINASNITAGKLYAQYIEADQLSSISSNLGDITAGSININDMFIVDSSGNMTANSGTFTGDIYASGGTIGGFTINSDSLTGSNVTISPSTLSYGSNFSVTANGFMTAKTGEIAGFKFADTADASHRYANTLYVINSSDGYDYQAGLKASASASEAAFYVRKKSTNDTWSNSTLPFYVRNDGLMYCENLTVGSNFYMNGSTFKEDSDGNLINKRFRVLSMGIEDVYFGVLNNNGWRIYCGLDEFRFCYDYGSTSVDSPLVAWRNSSTEYSFFPPQDTLSVNLGSENGSFNCLYVDSICLNGVTKSKWPTGSEGVNANEVTLRIGSDMYGNNDIFTILSPNTDNIVVTCNTIGAAVKGHTHAYLKDEDQGNFVLELRDNTTGSSGSKYIRAASSYNSSSNISGTVNLGTDGNRWKSVHTNALYLDGTMINSFGAGLSVSDGVLSASGTSYTSGTGITISGTTISVTSGTYVPMSGTTTSSPVSGTLHMANNSGWNLINNSGNSVTGIYCTKTNGSYTDDYGNTGTGNLIVLSDHNYTTVLRGSTIMIGNKTSTKVRMPSLTSNTSATRYLVCDSNGNIGYRTDVGGSSITSAEVTSTNTGNAGTNASATVKLSTDKTKLSFTFTIPKGKDGTNGTNGKDGRDGVDGKDATIQGTHYLSSNTPSFGINISSNLAFAVGNNSGNTKGNYISMGNLYNYSGSGGKMVYVNNGGTLYSASSSKRYKHDIVPLDINSINKLYDLDVVTYKYNADHFDDINDPDINKTFIGMIAEDIAEICPTLAVYDSQGRVEMWDEFQFPACLMALIQNNHKEISSLKSQNKELQNQILNLQGELLLLKQQMEELKNA